MTKLLENDTYPATKPAKILQKIFNKEVSGRLTIYDVSDESIQWKVYVGKGKVLFATSAMGHYERIKYFINRYLNSKNIEVPLAIDDDYQYIYNLWQQEILSVQQVRQLLMKITQEALIQCLCLPESNFHFDKTIDLNPLLLSVSGSDLVKPVKKHIFHWIKVRSEISSPFQRVVIQDVNKILDDNKIDVKHLKFIAKLKQADQNNSCIYDIASNFSKHTLELALLLQPLVNLGGIKMLPYRIASKQTSPLIACIDDSRAIQRIVKMTLEASGFRVISILDPATAMTSFVTEKPDLILMDINMPEIDGYKLSYMFRQSSLLRDIPIIMLTGRDGILDRVRAKMVGAIDYISKPFIPQELLKPINNYLTNKAT